MRTNTEEDEILTPVEGLDELPNLDWIKSNSLGANLPAELRKDSMESELEELEDQGDVDEQPFGATASPYQY